MILEFFKVFYLATTVFSNVYIPSSHTALHNIYEITKCFAKYRTHMQLQPVVVAMEVKYFKYLNKFHYSIVLKLFWILGSNLQD